uniref:G-protein coupled receptors family 1 profile domain-containing protein n=1 Tax=Plectus sambesii TaxID=2011161 RepID=A0A914XRN4_9BILA
MPSFDLYWDTLAVLGVFSFVVYLFIMFVIIKNRKNEDMQSSFFKLWISLGVADCLHFIHSYTLMRLPLLGVFHDFYQANDSGVIPVFALLFSHYLFQTQLFGNLLFAINRYTAVAYVTKHELIWTNGYRLLIIIGVQWLLPLITVGQIARQNVVFTPLPPDNVSLLLSVSPHDFVVNSIVASFVALFVMVSCAFFYIAAVVRYVTYKKNVISSSLKKKNNSEMRLLAAAIIVFISMAFYSIYQICLGVFSFLEKGDIVNTVISQWYLINDVFAMINPWSLLLTCSSIRRHLWRAVGVKQSQNAAVSAQTDTALASVQRNKLTSTLSTPRIVIVQDNIVEPVP